jgi:hypothetical protein
MPGSKIWMAAVAGISLLVQSASTAASAPARQPDLIVQVLSVNGSGCPAGSADVTPAGQPAGLSTVRYRNFVVAGGDYRSCVLTLSIAAPAGWTYLIPSVEYRARLKLGASATAGLATNMWLTGFDWTVHDDKQVAGPLDNLWTTTGAPGQPMWAPCGESVNLTVAETVRVTGAPSDTARLMTTTLNPPKLKAC